MQSPNEWLMLFARSKKAYGQGGEKIEVIVVDKPLINSFAYKFSVDRGVQHNYDHIVVEDTNPDSGRSKLYEGDVFIITNKDYGFGYRMGKEQFIREYSFKSPEPLIGEVLHLYPNHYRGGKPAFHEDFNAL